MQKGFTPVFILIAAIVLALGAGGLYFFQKQQAIKKINSFEECAKHYPVTMSYPGQCHTPDGRTFIQPLSDEEKKKLIPPSDGSANWKTYSANGIVFKYPPTHEVIIEDPNGKKNPKIVKVGESFAARGLYIDWEPYSGNKGVQQEAFDLNMKAVGGSFNIIRTFGGKDFYFGCQFNEDKNEVAICNQILSTFKFLDSSPSASGSSKNQCGDGVCQEVTCAAIGCPVPETPQNCPQDCK